MKTNANLLARLATLALVTSLAACGGGGDSTPGAGTPTPTPTPGNTEGTALTGVLAGPVGSQAVLQNNGADNLPVTIGSSGGAYDRTPFTFAAKQLNGSPWALSVASTPQFQTCAVYAGATGTMPMGVDSVKVGCEYVYDHLSRNADGSVRGTFFDSTAPMLGGSNTAVASTTSAYGEGRFAVFVSSVAVPGVSTGANRQVYWRDRFTGQTQLISAAPPNAAGVGVQGNGDSFSPAVSADGLTVAFQSFATNLVTGDTNNVADIFVWNAERMAAGAVRVSVGPGLNGVQANAVSDKPSLSGDGKVVAFTSGASNLTAGVSGINAIHVYRRDLTTGTNTLVSINGSGPQEGNHPVLSDDGNRLAFSTFWPLLASDANNLWDIYVYDHAAAVKLSRVSLTSTGDERNQGTDSASRSVAPAISGDGRYVSYATTATNVVPGAINNLQNVFVVDTSSIGSIGSPVDVVRASVGNGMAGAVGNGDSPIGPGERAPLSADGKWVAFTTMASNLGTAPNNVLMRNWATGETRVVSNHVNGVGAVSLSRDGSYAAFGAGSQLDGRFASTGLFARFTGVGLAYMWN